MAIKELTTKTLGKQKSGWHWDRKRELYSTWQVDTTFLGTRHIRRGFRSKKEAEDYAGELKVQERLKEIGYSGPIKFPLVEKLFEKQTAAAARDSERALRKRIFAEFLKLLPANARLDEIERKHIKDYSDKRIAAGIKEQTANREITCIASALYKASDYFTGLEKWTPPKIYRPKISDHGRERVMSRDERERLIPYLLRDREADESHRRFLARKRAGLILYFGLLTGLRHGEICRLEKSNFDPSAGKLLAERFKTKKSGVHQTIFQPLTDTQLWVLDEAAKLYPDGKYFFSDKGKNHNKFYAVMKAACAKLDIPYGRFTEGGFIMHDTRHTFVTALEHGSVDSSTTRSFSGHSKDAMMKRYAHATQDSRIKALQIIENEFGRNGSGSQTGDEAELKRIYEAVAAGKMKYKEFKKAVAFFNGFLT